MSNLGRSAAWVLVVVATVLLVSYGGAIVAAPITIPLLFLAARRSSSSGFRICAGIVVVLTIAEAVWALTFLTVGEARPTIWLVPLLGTIAGGVAYTRLSRPSTL
jgi:energy-converting hydrogenase Eha subunit G